MSSLCEWRSEGDESGSVWAFGCGRSHEPNQARRALVNAAKESRERTTGTKSHLRVVVDSHTTITVASSLQTGHLNFFSADDEYEVLNGLKNLALFFCCLAGGRESCAESQTANPHDIPF